MADYWHLLIGALFMRREAYEYQRDNKDSFARGLLLIVIIGVAVAIANVIGAALRYASSPNPDAVKNTVLTHLQAMPFYTQTIQPYPSLEQQWLLGYNQVWQYLGSTFMGFPIDAAGWASLLATIITTPVIWLIAWVVYAGLAHLIASRGATHVEFSHALGTLALATAPQIFGVVGLLPNAGVNTFAIWLWSMILNAFALHAAYRITTRRAIWAALFPVLLLLLPLLILLVIGLVALGSLLRGGGA